MDLSKANTRAFPCSRTFEFATLWILSKTCAQRSFIASIFKSLYYMISFSCSIWAKWASVLCFSCFSPNSIISEQKSCMHSFRSLKVKTMPSPDVNVFVGSPLFLILVKNTYMEPSLLEISRCWCRFTESKSVAQNLCCDGTCLSIRLLHISKLLEIAAT